MKNKMLLNILIVSLIVVVTVLITLVVVYVTSDSKEKEPSIMDILVDPEEYFTDIATNATGSKLKTGFKNLVDFVFYGEKINNISFDSLKEEAKLKILGLAYKIDSKIEQFFPGYKETIKSALSRIYTNIKERLTKLYLSIVTKVCTNNPEFCLQAKEDFEGLKESFGLTFDFIKDWYQSYKTE